MDKRAVMVCRVSARYPGTVPHAKEGDHAVIAEDNSRGIASSLFSSAQSLRAGLFPAPFLPDNCVSGPADSLVLLRRSLGLHDRYFGAGRLVSARLCHRFARCRHSAIAEAGTGEGLTNLVSFLATFTMLLSVAVMAVCARGGYREWQVIDNVRS